ncbi:hypothetical protein G9P44_001468 [Scheffersomyces stipitis]|nr:hypothetical protein G9P44_001468 [Scheffersomyces stipitis]
MNSKFAHLEDVDGVRFNWNLFPSTRLEASRLTTPLGCLYTPLHARSCNLLPIPQLTANPLSCDTCGNYVNPYIKLDRANGMWWCPFCEKRTSIPKDYAIPASQTASVEDWPIEWRQTSTTVVYELPEDIDNKIAPDLPLVYLFVVDLYQHIDHSGDDSFETLKSTLASTIATLPTNSLVGLITYDETVKVYNISSEKYAGFPKDTLSVSDAKTFSYKKVWSQESVEKVLKKLQLQYDSLPYDYTKSEAYTKGILVEVGLHKTKILETIHSLSPKYTDSYKPLRSSGLAHYISTVILANATHKNCLGKVLFLASGPCTNQPGRIITSDSSETIRSHKDIQDMKSPNFVSSSLFYKTLSYIACGQTFAKAKAIGESPSTKTTDYDIPSTAPRWSVDMFSVSLDQVGICEMRALADATMGKINLYETFTSSRFKSDLLASVRSEDSHYMSTLSVSTSKDLKLSQLIFSGGYALPSSYSKAEKHYEKHHDKISDTITNFDSANSKRNFTNRWSFNCLTCNDTMSLFFESITVRSSKDLKPFGTSDVYIQFQLKFWDVNQQVWKLRITTIKKPTTLSILLRNQIRLSNGDIKLVNSKSEVLKEHEQLMSFDQECWTILLARLLINKIDTALGYDKFDNLIKTIDKVTVKLLKNFGGMSVKVNHRLGDSNPYSRLQQIYEINENFKNLTSYIYNLRKNPLLVNVFNSSPDETSFYHSSFLRLGDAASLTAIQPKLFQLANGKLDEILLDSNCLKFASGTFLIMDATFSVTIYFISSAENKLKLHPSNNDSLVDSRDSSIIESLDSVKLLLGNAPRPMIPKIIVTQTGHSQARFLISRLNPIEKDLQAEYEEAHLPKKNKGFFGLFGGSQQVQKYDKIMTDELSLKQYYDGLIKLIDIYRVEDD